jgi:hypothetical protein
MLLQLILLSIVLVAIALAGLAIKMFVLKGGEFKKQCGSVDPKTGQQLACSCGSEEKAKCENEAVKA